MFRLRCTVRDYLSFEVFGETTRTVWDLFEQAVWARARKHGWSDEVAQAEIDSVKSEWIETISEGATVDGESP